MNNSHLNMIVRQIANENCIDKAVEMLNRSKAYRETHNIRTKLDEQIESEQYYERDYIDRILSENYPVTTEMIADDYDMTADELNEFMRTLGIQYKACGQWVLYSKYCSQGYTITTAVYDDGYQIGYQTLWTQKGRLFLYNLFKKADIYPIIERDDD